MNDKRSQLIEAAIDLFSKEGFWNTSTARISKHAKVATGTLFNYFPSKEDLIDEVYLQLKHEVLDTFSGSVVTERDIRGIFHDIWTAYTHWGVKNPARFTLLEQLRLSNMVSQKAQDQMTEEFRPMLEIIQAAQRDKLLADIDFEYLTNLIGANMETTVKYAVDNKLKGKKLVTFCEKSFVVLWEGISG